MTHPGQAPLSLDEPPTLVLTADEIAALQAMEGAIPPGIGPGGESAACPKAGVRSLAARSLIDGAGRMALPLAVVLATYACALRRLAIEDHRPGGTVQRSLHVGPEAGVVHQGVPDGLHAFAVVDPGVWNRQLERLVLGQVAPDSDPDRPRPLPLDDLVAAATRYLVAAVVERHGDERRCTEAVLVWTDRPWLIDPDTRTGAPLGPGSVRRALCPPAE